MVSLLQCRVGSCSATFMLKHLGQVYCFCNLPYYLHDDIGFNYYDRAFANYISQISIEIVVMSKQHNYCVSITKYRGIVSKDSAY